MKNLILDGLAMQAKYLRKDSPNKLYLPKQMEEHQLEDLELDDRAVVETDSSETKTEIETEKFFRDQDRDRKIFSRPRPRPRRVSISILASRPRPAKFEIKTETEKMTSSIFFRFFEKKFLKLIFAHELVL